MNNEKLELPIDSAGLIWTKSEGFVLHLPVQKSADEDFNYEVGFLAAIHMRLIKEPQFAYDMMKWLDELTDAEL